MDQTYSLSSFKLLIGRRFNDAIFAIVSKFAHSITAVNRDGTDIPEVWAGESRGWPPPKSI